jgi:hypothetical protein
MHRDRFERFLLLALVFFFGVGANALAASSEARTVAGTDLISVEAKAAACVRTLEQFVPALDAVLAENPRSILKYDAVLAKYLFLKNGIPGLPAPATDASVEGCNIDQIVEIARRSRFFYRATEVSQHYLYHLFEFRSPDVIVGFAIEKSTGDINVPYAKWIKIYP